MTTARDKFQTRITGSVAASTTDQQLSAIVPNNEKWHLGRVVFAHANDNRNISGGFQLEWGDAVGGWTFITGCYLTGATFNDKIDQTFTGNGVKRFRLTRQNLDTVAKTMSVVIDGFKRIGD